MTADLAVTQLFLDKSGNLNQQFTFNFGTIIWFAPEIRFAVAYLNIFKQANIFIIRFDMQQ